MTEFLRRSVVVLLAVAGVAPSVVAAEAVAVPSLSAAERVAFFEKTVQPILKANCFACHGGEPKIKGGLRLISREAILKGGESGPAVTLEKPAESLLLKAVHYEADSKMPPKGKLPQANIDALSRWVELGLPWTPEEAAKPVVKHGPPQVNAETKNFWAFRPVKRPAVPVVKTSTWVANPIDAFVLAKLEAAQLKPATPASKATLIRRATYDLTGLPPTPEEVDAFVADASPRAYEQLLDRLLASPRYGERWGRHWLDLVRYAESDSFERDGTKPFVWRYRDYVIKSLNDDKPYDQFVREQLAGDELDQVTADSIIATGYYRLGTWDDEPADPKQALYDDLDDLVSTTSQAFLGLTVGCARCHDHKLDPIPQRDYYQMLAFFRGVRRYGVRGHDSVAEASLRPVRVELSEEEHRKEHDAVAAHEKKIAHLTEHLTKVEKLVAADFAPIEHEEFRAEQGRVALVKKRVPKLLTEEKFKEYQKWTKEREHLRAHPPKTLAQALCVTEAGRTPPKTFVLNRGNPHAEADEVQPGFLSVLSPPKPAIREKGPTESSHRRRALADWLTSRANPLPARVIVNRIWQHHFGRGIVRTPSNFGSLGTPPTHPELLDWFADEFVATGWRLKPMHKLMMLSSSYRMSATADPKALAKDPENDLCWRFDMRRLDAEEIRDSILAVNGTLNLRLGGPSIYPTIPPEILAGQSRPGADWNTSKPEDQARRSIYVHVKRSLPLPILASFDVADNDFSCPLRFATTQPTQALGMLNSTFINEQAALFADSIRKQAGPEPVTAVRLALRRTLQREPSPKEIDRALQLLTALRTEHGLNEVDAFRSFCLVALNLNEFIYLE